MSVAAISGLQLAAHFWLKALASASLEGGLAILGVYGLCRALPQLNARVKSWLWRLVFIRILLACIWVHPVCLPLLPASDSQAAPIAAVRAQTQMKHLALSTEAAAHDAATNLASINKHVFDISLLSWPVIMMLLWGSGVLGQVVVVYVQFRTSRRLRGALVPCPKPRTQELLTAMARRAGLKRTPLLMVASGITSPQLVGVWRPLIVLPETMVAGLSTKDLRLILAHELAHVRRRDLAWMWLATTIRILLFFHPLVWLAHCEWLLTQEMACDEQVIADAPSAARRYSHILLRLATNPLPRFRGGLSMTDRSNAFLGLRRRLESIYRRRLFSGECCCRAVIATASLAVVMSLPWHLTARANTLIPRPLTGLPLDFNAPGRDGATGTQGWESSGDGYEFVSDQSELYRGQASGRLTTKVPGYYGTLTQCMTTTGITGARLRLAAMLKTKGVTESPLRGGGAGLWLRVDDADGRVLSFANMQNAAVLGDHTWAPYSVDVDVARRARRVCFGAFLRGHGTSWINGVSLALVGARKGDGEVRDDSLKAPENLDFEDGSDAAGLPLAWSSRGSVGVQPEVDKTEVHAGTASVRLTAAGSEPSYGRLVQCTEADAWRGRRVALFGYLKTAGVTSGRAGLWMMAQGADTRPLAFDNMHDEDLVGTTDWRRYQVVLDIPVATVKVCYGATIKGLGTVWADDFAVTDEGPEGGGVLPPTSRLPELMPLNLNFEGGATASGLPVHWYGGGLGYNIFFGPNRRPFRPLQRRHPQRLN